MNKLWQFLVKYKWWVIAIAVIIIILIIVRKRNRLKQESSGSSVQESSASGIASLIWKDDSFPLKKWSSGERVKKLQTALNQVINGTKLDVDGKFGSKTEEAVNKFKIAANFTSGSNGTVTEQEYNAFVLPSTTQTPLNVNFASIQITMS
jgi:hypothetical protein